MLSTSENISSNKINNSATCPQAGQASHEIRKSASWVRRALQTLGFATLMSAASTGAMAQATNVELTNNAPVTSWGNVKGVDIAAPDASGISHNIYNNVAVSSAGLILNNAITSTNSTILGQAINANPNLGTTAASIILNEVRGTNAIDLSGKVEVVGATANVIFASANGISCNGCEFINTSKVTLAAGTLNFNNANAFTGITTNGTTISIGNSGLTAGQIDAFDLVASSVTVTGGINAKDLVISTGSHTFDYTNRTATAVTGTAPAVGLDASALGSISAGRIRLIATGTGVGINALGALTAATNDIVVEAGGAIQLSAVTAATGLSIKANNANVTMAGNVTAGQGITISGNCSSSAPMAQI